MEEKTDMTPQKPGSHQQTLLLHCSEGGRTVELGNEISKMQHLDHREMARILLK
jgi:hypothetical protein